MSTTINRGQGPTTTDDDDDHGAEPARMEAVSYPPHRTTVARPGDPGFYAGDPVWLPWDRVGLGPDAGPVAGDGEGGDR